MVQWVYENAKKCKVFSDVVVATDSEEIAKVIENIGGKFVLTNKDLPTGSDRVAAACKDFPDADVIVNLQGDEPFIKPSMLEELVSPYLNGEMPDMATLAYPINLEKNYNNPGAVKVITDLHGDALYFSRAPIPYFRETTKAPVYHHIGLYAFRREFLLKYTTLLQTPLEKAESLEQLRAIEHGYKIRVTITENKTLEINTQEEYEQAQEFTYTE